MGRAALALALPLLAGCGPEFSGRTETFSMRSAAVGDEFEIAVHLPRGYDEGGERYPVVYQLDGSTQSEPVAAIAEDLGLSVIVVGIGYEEGFAPAKRLRDYLPTPDERYSESSGRADRFFVFLEEGLVPRIDEDYRTSPGERTLMGHSYGGTAVFSVLFEQSSTAPLFDTFAAASPSLWWGSGAIFDIEEEHAGRTADLPVRLLVAYGAVEPMLVVGYSRAMVERLEERAYPGLDLEGREIEGATHSMTWPAAYRDALERFHGE